MVHHEDENPHKHGYNKYAERPGIHDPRIQEHLDKAKPMWEAKKK